MRGALAILAGFVLGVVAAALLLGGIVAFAPETVPPPAASPSVAVVLPTATPTVAPSPSASPSGPSASASAAASGAQFHVGEKAPALSVPQVGGGTIDLANLKGQPVWVDFVATDCASCKTEFPLMNGYANRYATNGLVVIAVDVREDEGKVATFAESLGATFPMGLDADGSAAKAWGALALPVHFWIDKDGIIRDGALGGIGPEYMNTALEKIMPGVDVTS
jgi:cytochrome c biogenesis protein CcmG, thiol:disulfide interchange protein DsbE